MYSEIAKAYNSKNLINKMMNFFLIEYIFCSIILLIIFYVCKINYLLMMISIFFISLLVMYFYFHFQFRKILSVKNQKKKYIEKLKLFFQYMSDINDNNLRNIINNIVNDKEDIKLLIDHYKRFIPVKSKANIFDIISSLLFSLISLFYIFIDSNTGEFKYSLLKSMDIIGAIVFIIITIVWLIFFIKNIILDNKTFVYEDLYDRLTFLYLKWDKK